jgi:L-seryl-tRNA(Ser) seleniumtransferase
MTSPRLIPSVDALAQRSEVAGLERRYGHDLVVSALREAAAELRSRLVAGGEGPAAERGSLPSDAEDAARQVTSRAATMLARRLSPSLRRVINATGVIIHTNLGRAPLAAEAVRQIAHLATGYTNLEYDIEAGRRGTRNRHAEALLRAVTGAEAAVVVNNNAAATLLMLAALAAGREVVISRGELVEIGGGFRVPDIMAQSGAVLREVGTTNRTRAADYAAAIGEKTALILRVHPSNFRIEGFTERPALEELVALGRRFGLPVAEDQGSGNLLAALDVPAAPRSPADEAEQAGVVDFDTSSLREPAVADIVRAGIDVVCFSGDKLLGGPQAGILAGRAAVIERLRTHPLMRALRVDKLTYAALEATLLAHASGRARDAVPVVRMLVLTRGAIAARADAIAVRVRDTPGLSVGLVGGASTVGGGSAPGSRLPTCLLAIALDGVSASALDVRLRGSDPPLVARIQDDRVVLDLRTVDPEDDPTVAALLRKAAVTP